MNEKNAINALKELTMNGTKFAHAYGMLGLEIKNPTFIQEYKPVLKQSKKMIEMKYGCFNSNEKVTSLLSLEKLKNYDWLIEKLNNRYQWLKTNNKLFTTIRS